MFELRGYWEINQERICQLIRECKYDAGPVTEYEIINAKGKRRVVSKYNTIDRFKKELTGVIDYDDDSICIYSANNINNVYKEQIGVVEDNAHII